ncbi:hypothetical protein D9M68_358330 [compost metagenome]
MWRKRKIGACQPIVGGFRLGLGEHVDGDVETFKELRLIPDAFAEEAGAAAEIRHMLEDEAPGVALDQRRELLRHRVAELFHQRLVEAIGIVVEQALDIEARRLFGHRGGTEKRQLQAGAEDVPRAQRQGFSERVDRRLFPARFFLIVREPKPAGCPVRRPFQRLCHQFGSASGLAALGKHFCVVGAAVGDQVAGGELVERHQCEISVAINASDAGCCKTQAESG